jgi:putative ABC transport system permease protein
MKVLLRYFSWRYIHKHPIRVLLSLLSVALGVALFVSVEVSNSSAEASFRRTVKKLSGNAQLQVVRGRMLGVEEEALAKIDAVPGVRAAPVLQLGTTLPGSKESLMVLGLDFQREAQFRRWESVEGEKPRVNPLAFLLGEAVVIPKSFAAKRGYKPGSKFLIDTPDGHRAVLVAAVVPDEGAAQVFGGNLAVMHVKTAQRLFRKPGRFDRIEVMVEGDVEAAARRLREALGPEYTVQPPPMQNSFLEEALTRIKAMTGISVIALLVAVFIIYNSVTISVFERVREIGTLRSIGATRGQVFRVILLEWSAVGLVGSALGAGMGVGLAWLLLGMTAGEVNQLMLVADVGEITVLPRTLVQGLAFGTLTSFVAAFLPGRQAMSIAPVEMLRQSTFLAGRAPGYRRSFAAGAVLVVLAGALVAGTLRFENVGLVACVLAFSGVALLLPQVTLWTSRLARPLLGRCFRIGGVLGADNLARAPQRTALTVITMAGAVAMMVTTASIILGFKVRGAEWLEEALPFDCQVSGTDYNATIYTGTRLPEDLRPKIEALEGVDFTYGVREALQEYGERDVMVFGVEMERYARMQARRGGTGFVRPGRLPDLLSGKGVVVSGNLAGLHGLNIGDSIELRTLKGSRRFTVLDTYEDYAWPQGVVYMDRTVYADLWEDPSISYLEIKFVKGAPAEDVRSRVKETIQGRYTLFVYDVADFKRLGDVMLDRTLRFTSVPVAVSMVIGFLGIVNTLLISVLRRTRELGLLRAVGMTRGQVGGMVLIESLFIAVVGGVLGVALGLAAAKWPVALHVFQIMGYQMPLTVPWGTVGTALGSTLVLGAVASILPARRAASLNILEAVTYE